MTTTTPGGIITPVASDDPNVPADLLAMAQSIEAGNTWVTSGFAAATGWTLVTGKYRWIGGLIFVYVDVTKATSALTVSAGSGDISNVAVATAPAAIWPATPFPLSGGHIGRVAQGEIDASGNINLGAVAGDGTNIATSDHINLSGWIALG